MNFLIGYGSITIFFIFVVIVMERTHKPNENFTDYAVAGRSFGSWFQAMAFLNTWLPGTMFIAFAGYSAAAGVVGYYVISYSLLAVLFMFFMAQRIFDWGAAFDLRTQADFLGMRYNSKSVRMIAAIIGVISAFPWLVLGFQSLGLVFSYLSFGAISPKQAVFVGIFVLAIRQIWTVRMGMRGIVISDMVQGIFAYGVGGLVSLGFIIWMLSKGYGFNTLPESFATIPGFGSDAGGLYYFSIVVTGALGAWCWPDIFVRLFTAKSAQTVRNSAVKAAPLIFLFLTALLTMAMLASQLAGVADAPDQIWFIVTKMGGAVILSIAGICVFAATTGNVNAITAAIGTHTAQDIVHINGASDSKNTRTARIVIVIVTVLAVIGAILTVEATSGLLTLALASYQGIVQLAPALYLGLLWRRGTATGANCGMVFGFIIAFALQLMFPYSIQSLAGLTSGMVGLVANIAIYVVISLFQPQSESENRRVRDLFGEVDLEHTEKRADKALQ